MRSKLTAYSLQLLGRLKFRVSAFLLEARSYKLKASSRGMTFIEVLVWISVFTLVMLAIVSTLLYFYRTNAYTLEQAEAVTSAQRALEQSVRIIREAAYSSQGAFPMHSIAADDLIFYADIDNDALIERVHYYISGTNLMRGTLDPTGNPPDYTGGETATVIAQHVRNTAQGLSTFRYYDELGAEITNFANWTSVRFIKVSLAVNVNVATLPNQYVLSSSAAIRNLI